MKINKTLISFAAVMMLTISFLSMFNTTVVNNTSVSRGIASTVSPYAESPAKHPDWWKKGIGKEIIYYVMIDRFFDGNVNNNVPNWAFPAPEAWKYKDPKSKEFAWYKRNINEQKWLEKMQDGSGKHFQHYQGGDLQGVLRKLPYLKELGVTTIMLSPIYENVNGLNYFNGNTAYHGYWTKDWYRLEEHFINPPAKGESLQSVLAGDKFFKYFSETVHNFGIKIYVDLSINQSSPISDPVTKDDIAKDRKFYNLEYGAIYLDGQPVTQYCAPYAEYYLSGKEVAYHSCRQTVCVEVTGTDCWYNPPAAMGGRDNAGLFKRVSDWNNQAYLESAQAYSMADLNQRNPKVKKYVWGAVKKWVDLGVDGFRVDGIKQMYSDYLLEFDTIVKKYADIIGRDIVLIGEYYDGGAFSDKSVEWINNSHETMFDFAFAKTVRNFFNHDTGYSYATSIGGDWSNMAFPDLPVVLEKHDGKYNPQNKLGERSDYLVTFINNHDLPRMMGVQGITPKRYQAAMAMMMLSRGIPKLFYGDEIGLSLPYHPMFKGQDDLKQVRGPIGGDPWNRLLMNWDFLKDEKDLVVKDVKVPLTKSLEGSMTTPELFKMINNYNLDSKTRGVYRDNYKVTKRLIELRHEYPFLWKGDTKFFAHEGFNLLERFRGFHFLAMERADEESANKKVYFFWSRDNQELSFKVKMPDGVYRDEINGKVHRVSEGIVKIAFREDETVILGTGPRVLAQNKSQRKVRVTQWLHLDPKEIPAGSSVYMTTNGENRYSKCGINYPKELYKYKMNIVAPGTFRVDFQACVGDSFEYLYYMKDSGVDGKDDDVVKNSSKDDHYINDNADTRLFYIKPEMVEDGSIVIKDDTWGRIY